MNAALVALIIVGVVMCEPRYGHGHSGEDDRGHHHGGHGLHHGGHGCHHRGPPPPPFLKNVSKAARHAYFEIIFNENETIAEQNKDVLDWGKKYGVEEQVEEFFKNMSATRAEAKQNVTELIKALPKAMDDFMAIMENEDQTRPQQREALRVLMEKDPLSQSALRFIMDMYRPKRPCHPHHMPRRPESESVEGSNDVKEKRDLDGFDDSGEDNQ